MISWIPQARSAVSLSAFTLLPHIHPIPHCHRTDLEFFALTLLSPNLKARLIQPHFTPARFFLTKTRVAPSSRSTTRCFKKASVLSLSFSSSNNTTTHCPAQHERPDTQQQHTSTSKSIDIMQPFWRSDRPEQHLRNRQIEDDRTYAERLAGSFYDDDAQIAMDHQLAVQLERQRSASPPRREGGAEMAMVRQRERSVLLPNLFGFAGRRGRGDQGGLEGFHCEDWPTFGEDGAEMLAPHRPGAFDGAERELNPPVEAEGDDDLEPEEIATRNCVGCGDATTNRNSLGISCGHRMCYEDVLSFFTRAMTDEELFPPRCCAGHEISTEDARRLLGRAFPAGFDARALELRTVDRTYCHVPECSTFIPPIQIVRDMAVCPTCTEWTCTTCKQAGHERGECPEVC